MGLQSRKRVQMLRVPFSSRFQESQDTHVLCLQELRPHNSLQSVHKTKVVHLEGFV